MEGVTMEADEKTCPRCAEVIKAAAQVCKHCGYEFNAQPAPVNPVQAKKKSPMKMGCLILAGVVIVLAVIGSMGGRKSAPSSAGANGIAAASGGASATPPIAVTASALAAAYAANEAAAQQKYGSGPLEVSGILESVDLGIGDVPSLVLRGNEMFTRPQMALTEASQAKAASLSKGQKITAVCASVSEIVGTPMLSDCELQ